MKDYIIEKLKEDWSPEEIAGDLRKKENGKKERKKNFGNTFVIGKNRKEFLGDHGKKETPESLLEEPFPNAQGLWENEMKSDTVKAILCHSLSLQNPLPSLWSE